jgi:hypothetical protein
MRHSLGKPGFPVESVGINEPMPLSVKKAAYADVSRAAHRKSGKL